MCLWFCGKRRRKELSPLAKQWAEISKSWLPLRVGDFFLCTHESIDIYLFCWGPSHFCYNENLPFIFLPLLTNPEWMDVNIYLLLSVMVRFWTLEKHAENIVLFEYLNKIWEEGWEQFGQTAPVIWASHWIKRGLFLKAGDQSKKGKGWIDPQRHTGKWLNALVSGLDRPEFHLWFCLLANCVSLVKSANLLSFSFLIWKGGW